MSQDQDKQILLASLIYTQLHEVIHLIQNVKLTFIHNIVIPMYHNPYHNFIDEMTLNHYSPLRIISEKM